MHNVMSQMELHINLSFDGAIISQDVVAQKVADALERAVHDGAGLAPDDEDACTTRIAVMVKDNRDTYTSRNIQTEAVRRRSYRRSETKMPEPQEGDAR